MTKPELLASALAFTQYLLGCSTPDGPPIGSLGIDLLTDKLRAVCDEAGVKFVNIQESGPLRVMFFYKPEMRTCLALPVTASDAMPTAETITRLLGLAGPGSFAELSI